MIFAVKSKRWVTIWLVMTMMIVLSACGQSQVENANEPSNNENEVTENDREESKGFPHITGIEPGAGVMVATEKAISDYGLDIELVPSSSASMAASLKAAIEKEEWIVVTGWTPHWKFAAFDLKYLDDPLGSFGGEEAIHTIVRQGLEEEHPQAYRLLDQFYWETSDMESIMLDIYENNADPREAAQRWIDQNRDKVDQWLEGVEPVDGGELKLVYVSWDSEIASTNMIALVLEEIGYQVELTPVDNTPMWQAIAEGTHDAMVAAWLPGTHAAQYEQFKDQVVDLGPNLEGAKIGLVVPTYVDIDSIADIRKTQ
jgi:glycine betaine/proline transport system substrate-binding protein